MRYPTMTLADPAGVYGVNNAPAASAAPVEESKASPAQPSQPPKAPQVVEYGNKPPPLDLGTIAGVGAAGTSNPQSYNEKLEAAFPSARNSDPANRAVREAFFTVKDFGYDDYEKNAQVIDKMK